MDTNIVIGVVILGVIVLFLFYMIFMPDNTDSDVSPKEEKVRIENERR